MFFACLGKVYQETGNFRRKIYLSAKYFRLFISFDAHIVGNMNQNFL